MNSAQNVIVLTGLGSCLLLTTCTKETTDYGPVPAIEWVSVSAQQIKAHQDSLIITISYQDGDGDLGENRNDAKNLFVRDSRNNVVYQFRIKQLAPRNTVIAIKGKLDVILKQIPLVFGNEPEQVIYSLHIVDRKGHQSNTVQTPALVVIP